MDAKWSTDVHPGFRTNVVKVGNITIEINRPILSAEEQSRREDAVRMALTGFKMKGENK